MAANNMVMPFLQIENTGAANSETYTGLSLYYYKNKYDWDHRTNRQWIVHYHGSAVAPVGRITWMGVGDHFETPTVCECSVTFLRLDSILGYSC